MKLSDIKVPHAFKKTQPSSSKIITCARYYNKFGTLDKPITVNEHGVLIDGYIRYIVAQKMGLDEVPTITKGELRVYVEGQHAPKGKKYWWVVKKKDERRFLDKMHKGDQIRVNAKGALCSVTITNIELKPNPPIDKRIKAVQKF